MIATPIITEFVNKFLISASGQTSYKNQNTFVAKYLFLKQNPNIVLVDTAIIAKAPVRLLVSGMGDALATYFEARACEKSNHGTCTFGTLAQLVLENAPIEEIE